MGGIIALLASFVAISDSASAINLTVSQPINETRFDGTNIGQSFINDPSGTGATIKLNDWTFGLDSAADANDALTRTLSIFLGGGNSGTLVGSSTTTALSSFAGGDSCRWARSHRYFHLYRSYQWIYHLSREQYQPLS